ncbi:MULTISPECIES: LytTR family DNA-binding domain-containing protein [unclassified Lentimicrobium]|uniref:LytR/AlgR family response regulator transcription factor n=1 Tax=unclassified Lentimicrobium TaxID=2677434 RepID=UPI001555B0E9|nr:MULTISPECIES: LytTR family DNA-binding domain-containing protein [unclassified Lentimicrobium]NPD47988.1 response regulator transcription factor [Lentimicrobium sp. S6]NPD86033.1 response regulator transcription factor [Lentimicrobium sp. L6]
MNEAINRALIVDDEILAQEDLQDVISKVGNIEVVGKAKNLHEARTCIRKYKPNLIFLDIEMRGENGFDLIKDLDENVRVVFVTAYDEYAIKAFEVDAFDYLLKPASVGRLKSTIERLKVDSLRGNKKVHQMNFDDKIFIQINKSHQFLPLSEILLIEADDYYSKIYTKDGKKNLVLRSLKNWENRLPEKHFQRIHRSYIVNLNEVRKVMPWFNNSHRVFINGIEEPFALSRRYFSRIKKIMG